MIATHPVFHLCIDPVDNALAQQWGVEFNLDVQPRFPREGLFPATANGLVINLNYLGMTPLERAELVRRLFLTLLPYPVAVSSYDFQPETIEALAARKVIVTRGLHRDLFDRLATAIRARKREEDKAA